MLVCVSGVMEDAGAAKANYFSTRSAASKRYDERSVVKEKYIARVCTLHTLNAAWAEPLNPPLISATTPRGIQTAGVQNQYFNMWVGFENK